MSDFSVEYGKALYLLAKEDELTTSMLEEIEAVDSVLKENKEYISLMDTPALSLNERAGLIDDAFSTCSLYVKNFLKLLSEKKCFYCFSDCVKEYKKIYDEENNIERVEAISSIPLNEGQLLRLKEKIEKTVNKTVVIVNKVDESILGGVILRFNDKQYDGSVKSRLDDLSAKIKGSIF